MKITRLIISLIFIFFINQSQAAVLAGSPLYQSDGVTPSKTIRYFLDPDNLLPPIPDAPDPGDPPLPTPTPALQAHMDLLEAMEYIEQNTQLEFEEIPNINGLTFNEYIRIFYDPTLGNTSRGLSNQKAGDTCSTIGGAAGTLRIGALTNRTLMVHELLHALGFLHEQTRADRDVFLDFSKPEIEANESFATETEYNYNYGIPAAANCVFGRYDFESIMQYNRHLLVRRHDNYPGVGVLIDRVSANTAKRIRLRSVDQTASARDNLVLDIGSGNPVLVPLVQALAGASGTTLLTEPALWQVIERGSNSIALRNQNGLSLFVDPVSNTLDVGSLTDTDTRSEWTVFYGSTGKALLRNTLTNLFLYRNGSTLVLAPTFTGNTTTDELLWQFETAGPSLQHENGLNGNTRELTDLDIVALHSFYKIRHTIFHADGSGEALFDWASGVESSIYANSGFNFLRAVWLFQPIVNANGYIRIVNQETKEYLYLDPADGIVKTTTLANGQAMFGTEWPESHWILESLQSLQLNPVGVDGFGIRSRVTNNYLNLNGQTANEVFPGNARWDLRDVSLTLFGL